MSNLNRQPRRDPRLIIPCVPEQRACDSTQQIHSSSQQNGPSAHQRCATSNRQTQAQLAQNQEAPTTPREQTSPSQKMHPPGQPHGISAKDQEMRPRNQQVGSNPRQEGTSTQEPRPRSKQHTQSSHSQEAPTAASTRLPPTRPEQRANQQPPPSISRQAKLAVAQAYPTTPQAQHFSQLSPPSAPQQQRRPVLAQECPARPQESLPVYIPSKLPQFRNLTPTIRPDPQAEAAAKLDLSRRTIHPTKPAEKSPNAPTPSNARRHQRPWTLREWSFVSQIPKNIDSNEMRNVLSQFQEKFQWTPSEGQLRSHHWYFMKGEREMKAFLRAWEQYEERRMGIKLGDEEALVTKLRTMTLRPRW